MGFDLVTFSGGKGIRGPQNAGLLLGRKDLIAAAAASNNPFDGVGRGMKVAKEQIVGMVAAVDWFLSQSDAGLEKEFRRRADRIATHLKGLPSIETEVVIPPLANHVPHLLIRYNQEKLKISPRDVMKELRGGTPSIELNPSTGGRPELLLEYRPTSIRSWWASGCSRPARRPSWRGACTRFWKKRPRGRPEAGRAAFHRIRLASVPGVLRLWDHVSFTDELRQLLPGDLPFREECIAGAARHLELIVETNQQFNLTRIVSPREAAIKHVLDSVLPWRLFEGASEVADAGSGAGFPGIPLSLVLPGTRFMLLESTQKKARFLESVVRRLDLPNVQVRADRAEEWLNTHRVAIVTARAVAPLNRAASLFAPALRGGARILLYKGPDAATEIAEAAPETAKRQLRLRIIERYELPDAMGTRTVVEMKRVG